MKAEERRKGWNRCERAVLLGLVRPRVGELEPQVGEGGEAANDRAVFKARLQQNEGKTSWERAERRERSAAGADSRALGVALARVLGAILGVARVESWRGVLRPRPGVLKIERRPTIEQQFGRDFGGRMER